MARNRRVADKTFARGRVGAAVALAALLILGACSGDDPAPIAGPSASPAPSPTPDPKCPLTGQTPPPHLDLSQPAIAVKVEDNPAAYPISGIEKADLVYEEQVEGGITRFMAIFDCGNTNKVGPVRSSRVVDPAVMTPTTRLLAAAGGNDPVRKSLKKGHIILIDEDGAGNAMRRVYRPGIASEHTLYGNTAKLRKLGRKKYKKPPPADLFQFGDLPAGGKKAKTVDLQFGSATTIEWKWADGRWKRSERGSPFILESGKQAAVDNLVIEEHVVNNSKTIVDVVGNPSIEIEDVTGSGKAIVFRDGRAFVGRWVRKSRKTRVTYETKGGKEMVFHPGQTWVELLPNNKGEIKGSVSFKK
jgi:hypothetical protein